MPYIQQNIRLRQTIFGRIFGFGKNHYSVHPYYVFQGRVTLFFPNNSLMQCRITMKFLHNFF